jgi:hypothetical protein
VVWRQLKELTDLLFLTLFPTELRDLLSLLFLMELKDLLGLLVVGEWWMSRDSKMRLVMEATGPSTEETHEVETSHLVALERDEGGGGNLELEHTGVGKLGGDRYKAPCPAGAADDRCYSKRLVTKTKAPCVNLEVEAT